MMTSLPAIAVVGMAGRFPGGLVLGADTVVVLGNEVLGKPVTPSEAEGMLSRLAGKGHRVITAVALARDDRVLEERLDATRVWFRPVSADFIRDYVATGEPLDKAGSYGLQGLGALLVERIDGDFYGVMGLPVRLVVEMLAAVGLPYRFTR